MIRLSTAFMALALAVSPAMAQQQTPSVALEGDVKLEKSVTANGGTKIVLEDPQVVVPGDRLLFSTKYANKGSKPADNFVVTNPVPKAVRVADDSAASLQVSVDGGKAYGSLATLTVKDASGAARPALADDITHIRWTVPVIAPGGSGTVEYHAIVR
ncbi:MAG: hypothetical protein B7X90_03100 [Novosphingobium sp. 17-62-19]|uniref:hypothetical protein n=1 Tax=Novosphingobium sp. 17-62-19 TaxID=1970406 RepID=UPI000BC771F4|nr:hypothetical protein [Novosphingobium sp. 17-62-19]OZA21113.1 MAG: hypothetical protein B7X90_03100 [Novosphingobium sp. 17-62-19]OZA72725.1 MAG: hypothetical protein B7X78_00440 [Sphingomonadales bacterium 39-62-4]HQS95325.1 hypothetical protein [Novosphingobium sp.]